MSLLAADLRAFFAAALKEVRQQRRYPTLFLGQLFWPALLPASWVLMGRAYSGNDPQALAAFAERAGSSDVTVFVFVGYAMYNWLSALLWGAGTALRQEQLRGTLEAVFVTPASRPSLSSARASGRSFRWPLPSPAISSLCEFSSASSHPSLR